MTLPAFAAERRRLLSIDRRRASGALSSKPATAERRDRDGRTPDRYINPAVHIMRTVSTTCVIFAVSES